MRATEKVTLYLEGYDDPEVLDEYCPSCGALPGTWCATISVSAVDFNLVGVVHDIRYPR